MAFVSEKAAIAVLDDDKPADWPPWGTTAIKDLNVGVEGVLLDLPSHQEQRFSLTLLMHPPKVLFSRDDDEWEHVIGALVDGSKPSGARADLLLDRFNSVCEGVAGASDGWYRRLGFYVVITRGPERKGHPEFVQRLREGANDVLGQEASIRVYPIEGDDFFLKMIEIINMDLHLQHRHSRRLRR